MNCATFEATLQPRQGSKNFNDDVDLGMLAQTPSNPQAAPEVGQQTRLAPHIQFIKPDVTASPVDCRPDVTPTSKLSASPNSCYPTYQAGVAQSTVGKALPPPPAMGGSPMASRSPTVNNQSFTSFVITQQGAMSPISSTPDRRASQNTFGMPSPTRTPRAPTSSPSARGGGTSSPMRSKESASGYSPTRRLAGGTRSSQSSSRIDPEQVPRPVGQTEAVKEEGGKVYETSKYHIPPAATAVCTIVDRGSASCEFMRISVNNMPSYPSTANTAHVPIVVVCQPFAELTPKEEPIPVINYGETGPLRCRACKAYVNPHFQWLNGGREATCNFCCRRIQVPDDYYWPLDDKGKRKDHSSRLELQRGTVDYIAPRDYSDVLPGVPVVTFVIEVSQHSVQSGLLPQVLWTLRSLLGFLEAPASRIAIITFDHSLHFYAFHPGLSSAREVTVSDIEDPFVPFGPEVLCANVDDSGYRSQVEALLAELATAYAETTVEQVAGCAALKAATELVASAGGGHVIMFHATLPNTGLGALRHRDDLKLAAKPDGGLFVAQQAPFFEAVAGDCLARGVAVSVVCAPAVGKYIDMASLSLVPRRTGGEICYFPGFDPMRDGERLHYDISRTVVQGSVYSCIFKIRCSKGLTVDSMYATWEPEVIDQSTFHVSRMSIDATVDFVVSHSERIEGQQKHAYFQVACLHTNRNGQRLIRIHTLEVPVTSSLSNVFRYTEIDSVTNLLLKQAASSALNGNGAFKEKLVKSCVDVLHAYRVNCASMTSAGQLILPESLKLLPLYVGSIRKMAAFRSGSDIRVDDRVTSLIRMLGLPIALTGLLVYPRIYTLWPLPERAGVATGVGDNVHMPPSIACSNDKLANDRIYLVDNGATLRLYIREDVPADVLETLFGVEATHEVANALERPDLEVSPDAQRVFAVVQQIRRERIRLPWQPFSVVVPGTPEEAKLLAMICEDRVAGEMNYVDFLCHIHKLVQNKQD